VYGNLPALSSHCYVWNLLFAIVIIFVFCTSWWWPFLAKACCHKN